MVDLLPMHRAREMLIQTFKGRKAILTEVASIARSIPCSSCGEICGSGLMTVVPANLLVGETMIPINVSAVVVDFLAVDA